MCVRVPGSSDLQNQQGRKKYVDWEIEATERIRVGKATKGTSNLSETMEALYFEMLGLQHRRDHGKISSDKKVRWLTLYCIQCGMDLFQVLAGDSSRSIAYQEVHNRWCEDTYTDISKLSRASQWYQIAAVKLQREWNAKQRQE